MLVYVMVVTMKKLNYILLPKVVIRIFGHIKKIYVKVDFSRGLIFANQQIPKFSQGLSFVYHNSFAKTNPRNI